MVHFVLEKKKKYQQNITTFKNSSTVSSNSTTDLRLVRGVLWWLSFSPINNCIESHGLIKSVGLKNEIMHQIEIKIIKTIKKIKMESIKCAKIIQ